MSYTEVETHTPSGMGRGVRKVKGTPMCSDKTTKKKEETPPASNRGAKIKKEGVVADFDWLTASFVGVSLNWVREFKVRLEAQECVLKRGKAQLGYAYGYELLNALQQPIGSLYFSEEVGACVVFRSEHAPSMTLWLRRHYPDHRITRCDSKIDLNTNFDEVVKVAVGIAESRKISISQAGDWMTPNSKGRTLYIGSRTSRSCIRIYEKGKEDGRYEANTVRVEMELKPKEVALREKVATMSPDEIWSLTPLSRELYKALTGFTQTKMVNTQQKEQTMTEQRLQRLVRTHKRLLNSVLESVGGDVGAFGRLLATAIDGGLVSLSKPSNYSDELPPDFDNSVSVVALEPSLYDPLLNY